MPVVWQEGCGTAVAELGMSVRHTTTAALVNEFAVAEASKRLTSVIARYTKVDLLLAEVGVVADGPPLLPFFAVGGPVHLKQGPLGRSSGRLGRIVTTEGVQGMATKPLDGPVPAAAVTGQRVLDLLEKAIDTQIPRARNDIARTRQEKPEATPAQVIRKLERMYVSASTGRGVVVGGAAAASSFSTGFALAMPTSSLHLSARFVLSIAEVHGLPIGEDEHRRTIVTGIMLSGASSTSIVPKVAERTGRHWGRQVVAKVPAGMLKQINGILGNNFVTKRGTTGILVLGQVAPIGFGALIGGGTNAAIATATARACRHAFGPPPTSWPR